MVLYSWEWTDTWNIDISERYGQPDTEGWYYGATYDRLDETIKSNTASGVTNKTSLVRKRRWIRATRCVSNELLTKLKLRSDKIVEIRYRIEVSLKEKEVLFSCTLPMIIPFNPYRTHIADQLQRSDSL